MLDDVHWADNAASDLLRHLVTRAALMRVLVVATFRDSDLSWGDPLSRLIADMHREQSVSRIHLDGLSDVELMALMEAAAGHELEDDGVRLAHRCAAKLMATRSWSGRYSDTSVRAGEIYSTSGTDTCCARRSSSSGLPTSVRDVVARASNASATKLCVCLTVAAVIGREFAVHVLAQVADVDEDLLLDLLEAAVGGAVLTEPADRPGRFRFAHGLIQQTLYQDLGATRRQRLHARVAQAIEERSDGGDGDVPELACHWLAATRPAEQERALHYTCALATSRSTRSLPTMPPVGSAVASSCSTAMPTPRIRRAGRHSSASAAPSRCWATRPSATLLEAADLAERIGDRDLLIATALAPARGVTTAGAAEDPLLAVTSRALAAIGDDLTPDRVPVWLITLTEQTDAPANWQSACATARSTPSLRHARSATSASSSMPSRSRTRPGRSQTPSISACATLLRRLLSLTGSATRCSSSTRGTHDDKR